MGKILGITVLPEWIQAEGIEPLLDNLQRRSAVDAIATSPYVLALADEATGAREPPIDAGAGGVRLLDRDLWGRRSLFCRTAPSFAADPARYRGLRYQPPPPNDLTRAEGGKVAAFISAAKARGIAIWLQVQAAIPPGYRVQFGGPEAGDLPRLPDGSVPTGRVDNNASLASSHIRAYVTALIGDLAATYPEVDGFRVDWPEYPPYTLDSIFLDFSDAAMAAGRRLGYDTARMRHDAAAARHHLRHTLAEAELRDGTPEMLAARYPGLADLFRLKADIVAEFIHALSAAMPAGKKLVPQAFPPPWNALSGFDYARAGAVSDAIGVKLYTMHWPMMLHFYADALIPGNSGLDSAILGSKLTHWFATGGPEDGGLSALHYPEPDEPHPVGAEAQSAKVFKAQAEAGACPVYPFAHSYGPLEDFAARAAVAWDAGRHGIWVNRYGYLSDEKLDRLGEIRRA